MNAKGDGTYYRTAEGYFGWRLRLDGGSIVRTAKTQKLLRDKVRIALDSIEQGEHNQIPAMSLGAWIDAYLSEVVKPNRAWRTYRQAEQMTRLYVRSYPVKTNNRGTVTVTAESLLLKQVTPAIAQRIINRVTGEMGLDAQTAIHVRSVMRRCFNVAIERGLVTSNPFVSTTPPRLGLKKKRTIAPESVQAFLGSLVSTCTRKNGVIERRYRYGAFFQFGLATGLRIQELLGLQRSDIHRSENANYATITQTLHRPPGEPWTLEPVKTAKGNRVVPLSALALAALDQWNQIYEQDRALLGDSYTDQGFLFATVTGEPLSDRNTQASLDRILSDHDLPHISHHDIRRSFGSLLASSGVSLQVVSELLGHSDISVTKAHYVMIFGAEKNAAVNNIQSIS